MQPPLHPGVMTIFFGLSEGHQWIANMSLALRKPNILVVDDSGFARRHLHRVLEAAGYAVEEAVDGMQAIERYHFKRHDLVILDNVMPGMSGLEVLEQLRAVDPMARVIMLTSDVQDHTRQEASGRGAAGFLNKPLQNEELLSLITQTLAKPTGRAVPSS